MDGIKWLVLWSLWAARVVRQPTVPVRVAGGLLRGSISNSGTYAEYFAIPYATVVQRFQEPGPEPKWEGILEAVNENIRCVQRFTGNLISGQEDCLTLNIYTPLKTSPNLYPVMVFIHGGGFRDGSSSPFIYGPDYLIKHEVILVTFNYRLENLGFLCLGIKEAPGNVGLKDQVAALKWIKQNIKAFGGDPDSITIFGESAGAASVSYHIISPISKGLFHRAIMQSGSSTSPWALQMEPLKVASQLAYQFGSNTTDPYEIYNLLMTKSAKQLLQARVPRRKGDILLSENIFTPCIEKIIPNTEQFLAEAPYKTMVNGQYNKVPIIIGYNSAEGYMFAARENDTTIANLDFVQATPVDLSFPTEKEKRRTAMKLKNLYMGNEEVSKKTIVKVSFFEGDAHITYPVIATTELLLKTSDQPVYSYKFNYDGWMNIVKFLYGFRGEVGATHADELFYMFKLRIPLITAFYEKDMINTMSKMWTNFAKFSNPTPESTPSLKVKWQASDRNDPYSLVIDKYFTTIPLWEDVKMLFWNATYTKYRKKL
ncbi:acetylcholinesterase-like [Galleria mellonella]|uniref:Carboxylic ester hydrolase n=1 Tax=Galleria mellonella TaxID=7137 RepID=A0A6J1X1Y3_GALME|nr:acetylcholinesterase-like [Galleria mellonella]XP_052755792.1 acetylcholinesterase-like [Galleria mellonella]